jgi:1,4-dihydroxy-2-naphthoyl-CoA hydrolase
MEFPTFNPEIANALREATKQAPYPSLLGIEVVDFRPGAIVCRLAVDPKIMSGVGAVHGGAIVSLIDHALSLCVYPLVEIGKWVATLEFKVNYLAPVRPDAEWIEAEANVLSLKKRVAIVRIDVKTKSGEHVASAQGTGYIRERL